MLDAILEEVMAMQVESTHTLNQVDLNEIEKTLKNNKESAEFIASDFAEYLELKVSDGIQGSSELASNLSWILNEASETSGVLAFYLQLQKIKKTNITQLSQFELSLDTIKKGIMLASEESQTVTASQLADTVKGINLVLTSSKFILLVVFLLCLGISFWLQRVIKKPLQQIVSTLHRLSQGDLTVRCTYDKDNEFGLIAENLNLAINNQQKVIKDISAKSEKIDNISEDNLNLGNKLYARSKTQKEVLLR
ncbi:HAMP domain-containing protein [Psychromonas sp. MME1]|uniref:HAMP domain-containing protein n=1 Tax=Psychromonas sp. MME1 TaxID=3231032 RepID=UPI0034E1B22C